MADILKDLYELNYSDAFSSQGLQESVIDLTVDSSTKGNSSVVGVVSDTDGNQIENVTVKIFDENGVPFLHTLTKSNGGYSFPDLASGNYFISAVKDGYILTVPYSFHLSEDYTLTHNFTIAKDSSLALGSVAGHITTMQGEKKYALAEATISILNHTTLETIATTYSASDGEYLFYGLNAGSYYLIVSKGGYIASDRVEITLSENEIVNLDVNLMTNPVTNVGTISGKITHNGAIVSGCFVGLYETEEESDAERLIAVTKTNASGIYMFGSVASGNYKVKAKMAH